ncbi:acyl-CoA dehydrogenase/oxidase [Fimicolochytrium jonesii]|uniref:acyl-CoA dehydrogenase/oxidase n=1 Tax=Fimicolochytrium jonesii TaxID=1396493 RepID=UPI0022FE7809|nr:acyl-CoA dehydrogenase/oxidase [Fimicolochytrium jonesii]KAI8826586.1 acyl-CoA dehydrogenase/oxidase [Fimicolochytrium jonesii]
MVDPIASEASSAYDAHHKQFTSEGLPKNAAGWLSRAQKVSEIVATTAAQRDLDNTSPTAEVLLLKSSGLTKILGPVQYGGGGQEWDVAYKVIREVAKGDGSIGMLLGYHLLWSTTANVVGTEEQKERIQKNIIENNWFIGGAVNPRDADLVITPEGDELVFNGFKHFNTGGVVSDVTWLEGAIDGHKEHIFALVPSSQLTFAYNWDSVGLRGSESGSVRIQNVRVAWADALGWDAKTQKPIEAVLGIPYASLLLPTIQNVFNNFYVGIALGALDWARAYTLKFTRPWPYTDDPKSKAQDEFHILQKFGSFHAHLAAASALADVASTEIADLYRAHSQNRDVDARKRGEVAETIASLKIVATDTSLRVTSGIFEIVGARATGRKANADRFWRDIRTHTLHDPVAYKEREVGRYALLGEIPEPTWYT